ncbi:unnamed protein product, partial [Rhizoctonia solani]
PSSPLVSASISYPFTSQFKFITRMSDDHRFVRTLRADSKQGILVHQTDKILSSESDGERIREIVDVYLTEITWEEVNPQWRLTNDTKVDIKYEFGQINDISTTNTHFLENIKDVGFKLGGEWKTLSGCKDVSGHAEKITATVQPGETLYRYQQVCKFVLRTWWIMSWSGDQEAQFISNENDREPRYGYMKDEVIQGTRISVTQLTGEKAPDVVPAEKRWDESRMKGIRRSALPKPIAEHIVRRWKETTYRPKRDVRVAPVPELVSVQETRPVSRQAMKTVDSRAMQMGDIGRQARRSERWVQSADEGELILPRMVNGSPELVKNKTLCNRRSTLHYH